jgi:D-3-phosphoglycerate dehydrogenase
MSTSSNPIIVGLGPIAAEIVALLLGSGFKYIENPIPQDLAAAKGAIVRAAFEFNKSVFDGMPNLKVIAHTGFGTELVDLVEADARNIPVVITPGGKTNAMAEETFAHILALSKRLGPLTKLVAAGNWNDCTNYPVDDLENQTLGIIGFGPIGKRVASIASAFGMNTIAFDLIAEIPTPLKANSLAELLNNADVIILHVPLTKE